MVVFNDQQNEPEVDDEWERMYLDDTNDGSHRVCADNDHNGNNDEKNDDEWEKTDDECEKMDDEWEKMYEDFVGETRQDDKRNGDRNGVVEKELSRDIEDIYDPIPQIDDDWEAMYLDGNIIDQSCRNGYVDDDVDVSSNASSPDSIRLPNAEATHIERVDDAYLDYLNENCESGISVHEYDGTVSGRSSSHQNGQLSGRRIVDIDYLFKQVQTAGTHLKNCGFKDMTLLREIRSGLSSSFIFKCTECGTMTRIESVEKKKDGLGINRDALLGITSVGLGFSHLEELCANIDVPPMSYNLYRAREKVQQEDWLELAKAAALKALTKEIELAKINNEVDAKGNALIPVITDGSWGKRSYGQYFSSLSGCAVIIGLRTNKVIYFGVRNKYCHTCKMAQGKGDQVKEHKCYKNYEGPSTGMESDIIVSGFKECDELGARFNILISDGDSNTYKLIRDMRIYTEPDVFVAKLECVNHLFRNFYKKFNNLGTITVFNSDLRKKYVTPTFCSDLCRGIRKAAQHWRESTESQPMKIRLLEKDVLNAPAHCLGYHQNCNSYFCNKTTDPETVEILSALKDDGLYYEMQSLCQIYFGNNAKSLLANHTNNPAEQFNGYVAKFLGGKRINFSLAGSYTARVAMAVVHFNSGCHASSEYRRMKLGSVSENSKVLMLENKRKRKCLQNAVARTKKPKLRRAAVDKEKAYGGAYEGDMEEAALEIASNRIMEKLVRNQAMRDGIEMKTKDDQNYYDEKVRDLLMSHYFSNVINSKGPKFYTNILDEIVYHKKQLGNNAQNKHERVQQLEALAQFKLLFPATSIEECGLIIDDELPFLGARPFRLLGSDQILSIKCPLSEYKKHVDDAKLQLWKTIKNCRTLNTKSAWYIEIQGELHITKRKFAYLMVWLGDGQYQLVQLKRDDRFFDEQMREKLVYFYKETILKELADSRKKRGMELRRYDDTTKTFS